ncbi:c-type cytochrome [uncultured Winogradskyella sp.]|uniref:c-type cytochrome n=1 Tax=uncultured Winogradskyella sp. TaxID=395353 RepID=UPI00263A01CD|nr:c-type cytochrome [uncultured Winogradskyella sp.]
MKNLIFFVVVLFVYSCNNANKLTDITQNETEDVYTVHPGKKLMENQCYACHNPTTEHSNRIAPPMIAIKKHYINDKISKDEFIKSMQSWVENPNKADAKMYGAVRRFGIMPKAYYKKEDIKLIADYIYDNTIEQPDWFEAHYKQKGRMSGN